jgi:hypothetical protein
VNDEFVRRFLFAAEISSDIATSPAQAIVQKLFRRREKTAAALNCRPLLPYASVWPTGHLRMKPFVAWQVNSRRIAYQETGKMLATILIVILIMLLIGALPTWPYSAGWG